MNLVYLKCRKCGHKDLEHNFTYLGDAVHSCHKCNSMRVDLDEVVDLKKQKSSPDLFNDILKSFLK